MADDTKTRYAFLAEWFDTHAQLTRKYEFFFYPSDRTIEMVYGLISTTPNSIGHF
jgi:hypothetical protein